MYVNAEFCKWSWGNIPGPYLKEKEGNVKVGELKGVRVGR